MIGLEADAGWAGLFRPDPVDLTGMVGARLGPDDGFDGATRVWGLACGAGALATGVPSLDRVLVADGRRGTADEVPLGGGEAFVPASG
ncbi:MAG: hypothetical protein ACYDH9_04220 [Limisphaerales bacterium]